MGPIDFLKKAINRDIEGIMGDPTASEMSADVIGSKETNLLGMEPEQTEIGRKAIIEDPFFDHMTRSTIFKYRTSRLSNKMLKDVSLRDWLVSAIIQIRCDTAVMFTRPKRDKFDTGYKVIKKSLRTSVRFCSPGHRSLRVLRVSG